MPNVVTGSSPLGPDAGSLFPQGHNKNITITEKDLLCCQYAYADSITGQASDAKL